MSVGACRLKAYQRGKGKKMTRKDFEAMAGVVKKGYEQNQRLYDAGGLTLDQRLERDLATTYLRNRMAEVFRDANPRFDAERFFAACALR